VNAADPWVSVDCEFDNQAKDHRLSASFSAPIGVTSSISGQTFWAAERPLKIQSGKNWKQSPSASAPLQDFCAVEDRRGGMAVIVGGLYEYRAAREGRNTALKLTLMRAVGWLSRNDLLTRDGHAGPHLATPGAQCPGAQRFEYALMPYGGTWRSAGVSYHTQRFQAPVIDQQCANGSGGLPEEFSFIRIEPATLHLTALKKCVYRDTVILRLVNLGAQRAKAKIRCGKPLRHAWKVTIGENRIEEVSVLNDNTIEVDVPGWRILTVELELGRTMHGM
jgi:alpha-mannosidase